MKLKFIIALVCLPMLSFAQQKDSLIWKKEMQYNADNEAVWTADIMGNVYVASKKVIQKYDTLGILRFTQSIKSVGRIKEIMPLNSMKLVLFSEEQQLLCLMDNTLTMSENFIELSNYDIGMATLVAISSQPEKIWVIDQLNSRLLLLDLSGKMQFQEIRNLKSVLNLTDINSIVESEDNLFLLSGQTFYQFDMYGSLLNELTFSYNSSIGAYPSQEKICWLTAEEMMIQDLDGGNEIGLKLPLEGVQEFKKIGEFFYFRTADKILKYRLSFNR